MNSNRSFPGLQALRRHQRAKEHFFCPPCDRFFINDHALKQHDAANHSFMCDDCDKSFREMIHWSSISEPLGTASAPLVMNSSSTSLLLSGMQLLIPLRVMTVIKASSERIRSGPINGLLRIASAPPVRDSLSMSRLFSSMMQPLTPLRVVVVIKYSHGRFRCNSTKLLLNTAIVVRVANSLLARANSSSMVWIFILQVAVVVRPYQPIGPYATIKKLFGIVTVVLVTRSSLTWGLPGFIISSRIRFSAWFVTRTIQLNILFIMSTKGLRVIVIVSIVTSSLVLISMHETMRIVIISSIALVASSNSLSRVFWLNIACKQGTNFAFSVCRLLHIFLDASSLHLQPLR